MNLMGYLNEYRQSICYDTSGLINVEPRRHDAETDYLEQQKAEKYSSANVFPV